MVASLSLLCKLRFNESSSCKERPCVFMQPTADCPSHAAQRLPADSLAVCIAGTARFTHAFVAAFDIIVQ
jgi:hypothetical protein